MCIMGAQNEDFSCKADRGNVKYLNDLEEKIGV
jgi:hypothetical protein